jgi:hypothetical protein
MSQFHPCSMAVLRSAVANINLHLSRQRAVLRQEWQVFAKAFTWRVHIFTGTMGRTSGYTRDLGAKPFWGLVTLARARRQDQPEHLQAALDHCPS